MTALTDDDIVRLLALADLLIPGTARDEAAPLVLADGQYLRRAHAALPHLETTFRQLLDEQSESPQHLIDSLRAANVPALEALTTLISGAYFMVPSVRFALGYPGQVKNPAGIEEAVDDLDGDILDPVLDRGSIYRPTPKDS